MIVQTIGVRVLAQQSFFEIQGIEDVELGTQHRGPLRYMLSLPDGFSSGERALGLVMMIPGFGSDNNSGYLKSYGSWIADMHGLACVTVGYHAQGCRPSSGAQRLFTQPDADRLTNHCVKYGAALRDGDGPGVLMEKLHAAYRASVSAGQASGMITLTCGLVVRDQEPQNFGLMQAMDHLCVLADLRSRLNYDKRNVIAIGSSHGGYIAQLIAKLAPNTLRAVFDNAGYAQPPMRYINGREANLPDYIETYSDVMQMYFFLETMWSLDPAAANYFHADARQLRSLSTVSHLQAMADAGDRFTRYRCVHGPDDAIAPTHEKAKYCQELAEAGFDVQYKCMGPGDVDGQYVKSLGHGCGLSLRGFFERCYATLAESELVSLDSGRAGDDFDRQTDLSYAGPERAYRFVYTDRSVCVTLAPIGSA